MDDRLKVHWRIAQRHPEIAPEDVAHAWSNRIASATRRTSFCDEYIVVGFDSRGRMLEVIAVREEDGTPMAYHAMTPPSAKLLREIGLID